MTSSTCATTVHAIRDTELACLPAGLLNTIKVKQPRVVSRLIQVLGERILGTYNRVSFPISTASTGMHIVDMMASGCGNVCRRRWSENVILLYALDSLGSTEVKKHMVSNLSTVAVVPITSDVPLSHFTRELCSAICNIGTLINGRSLHKR